MDQHNLNQWLHDSITESLLGFIADRKTILEGLILEGSLSIEGYNYHCGVRNGLGYLELFIALEKEKSKGIIDENN